MATINWPSILAKAKAFMSTDAGQQKVDEQVNKMIYGKIKLQSGGGTPQEAAQAFISVLQQSIASSGLSPEAAAAISGFSHSAPLPIGKSVYEIYVYSTDDLSRPSLAPIYPPIESLLALFNNGVGHVMEPVHGYWHGTPYWSRTVIPGAHFVESAVSQFMGQYAGKYHVISIEVLQL